jgi:glutathione synthase/RimK-type ligase-like ATP-grasp enzyme
MVIQDAGQVEVYENKTEQFRRWGKWMPDTWVFNNAEAAMEVAFELPYPIVSKANEGASSVNVRIIPTKHDLERHILDVFSGRVMVNSCSGVNSRMRFAQNGYIFLQRFIPHQITWRVNAIGEARAIFKRYCYKNRPVAQTGNVDPVLEIDPFVERLLTFSDEVFKDLGTKWCAIDILHDEATDKLFLLETSLAWPWPSPGACMSAPLFKPDGTWQWSWNKMWHCMFEQVEEGVWARPA